MGPISGGVLAVFFYSLLLDPVNRPKEDLALHVKVVCSHCDQPLDGASVPDKYRSVTGSGEENNNHADKTGSNGCIDVQVLAL